MKSLKKCLPVFKKIGKSIALVFMGTLLIFGTVQVLNFSLLAYSRHFKIGVNSSVNFFSINMLTGILSYAALVSIIYYLYNKTRKKAPALEGKELEKIKKQAFIQVSQKLTGIMGEYISRYNTDIMNWVKKRKQSGQAPAGVEEASRKIGMALNMLSWVSYVLPYIERDNLKAVDFEGRLEKGLRSISYNNTENIIYQKDK